MNLFKFLLVAATFNAFSWMILTPLWQYPDEQAHFAQVQYIAEKGGIPKDNTDFDTSFEIAYSEKILGTERDQSGNNKFIFHPEYKTQYLSGIFGFKEKEIINLPKSQRANFVKNEATLNPPLYYNLASLIYKFLSSGSLFTRVFGIRLMSMVFFIILIIVSYKIGKLVFEKDKFLPISLSFLIAFKPMLNFVSTGVLPDSLTNLLFATFIYLSLMLVKSANMLSNLFLILIIVILGSATRQHFLTTLFILPIALLLRFLFDAKSRKKIFSLLTIFLLIIYTASYFVEPLNFIRRFDYPESSGKIINNPLANLTYFEHLKWSLEKSYHETFPWFWGIYKWLSLSLPLSVYRVIKILSLIALIGLALKLAKIVMTKKIKENLPILFLILSTMMYLVSLITFDYLFRKNNGYSFGLQGRYFFPMIVAELSIILIGLWQVFSLIKKKAKYLLFLLVSAMILFNDFSLFYVTSYYYDFSNMKTFIEQASQYKPLFIKGSVILTPIIFSLVLQSLVLIKLFKFFRSNS